MEFNKLGLTENILEGVDCLGFKNPTPIQEQAIPHILSGKDIIACAQTGTGKTGAFLIPVLDKAVRASTGKVNTLIIVPTRELAVQIDQQAEGLSYFSGASSFSIYGGGSGADFDLEKKALIQGADICIATPGRLIMHLNQNYADFSELKHLVLDEADRMLDMGFYEDLMKIIGRLPKERQTLMFSATMPPKIRKLAQSILKDPVEISLAVSKPAENLKQQAYSLYEEQKAQVFKKIIADKSPESTIIFTSSKLKVKEILRELKAIGFKAKGVSSDLAQDEREQVLIDFKNKKLPILVATDVLARGIHIEGIELVLNYDVPAEAEDYIHRIGRTARAQATGLAVTFITPSEQYKFAKIEKVLGREVEKPEISEEFGETPKYSPSVKKDFKRKPHNKKFSKPGGNEGKQNSNSSNEKKSFKKRKSVVKKSDN